MLFFLGFKFVNNCEMNVAGRIILNVTLHVLNNVLLPLFRWMMFPLYLQCILVDPPYGNGFVVSGVTESAVTFSILIMPDIMTWLKTIISKYL
jgi:hypothetical protein